MQSTFTLRLQNLLFYCAQTVSFTISSDSLLLLMHLVQYEVETKWCAMFLQLNHPSTTFLST